MRVIDLLWFLIPLGLLFLGWFIQVKTAWDQLKMNEELADQLEKGIYEQHTH